MTSKNNSCEWSTSTATRTTSSSNDISNTSSSSGNVGSSINHISSAMQHPNSSNEEIKRIKGETTTTTTTTKKVQKGLLYRHPSSNENLQPYFAYFSSSLVFMANRTNIPNFWITSLQMSSVYSHSLFRSCQQVQTDFETADGCQSLCATEILLHPSICLTYSNKQRNMDTIQTNNYKVIAISQLDISSNRETVIPTIAQLISHLWMTSNTPPAKPKSTNKAGVSVSHSNFSSSTTTITTTTTTTSYGKSFLSTVSWAATKLLSKLDLMDDPQEAQELQSCVELLQKDRDHISKHTITSIDSDVPTTTTTTSTTANEGTTQLLLSVDLIGHCCQYLLDRLPNAVEAILGPTNEFYSYYYKNTIRPQIILQTTNMHSSELVSFWKFCQLTGTTQHPSQQQRQPPPNSTTDDSFELSTAIPQLLSQISKDDSDVLFHVLKSSGKIYMENANNDDTSLCCVVVSDNSFREVDVALFRLLHAQWNVEQRVATYTKQYNELGIRAISRKHHSTAAAMYSMKQRKLVEHEIDKSQQIIFNLEQTRLHLEQAYTNKEMTNIFQLCRDAMKTTNHINLNIVDNIMLDLEEEMEQVRELSVSTHASSSNSNYYDLEDLERELAGLAIAAPPLKQVKSCSTTTKEATNGVDNVDPTRRINSSNECTPTLVDGTSDDAVTSAVIEESVEPSNTIDVPSSSLELLTA